MLLFRLVIVCTKQLVAPFSVKRSMKPYTTPCDAAVMTPVPQYPLFSCALSELGVARADYFLDEARSWALRARELRRAYARASRSRAVRALVVINPGNPTGQVSIH